MMNIYVNQHSNPEDIKNQMHQNSIEENKTVEVPYKGNVDFNENVDYEEMVTYAGTIPYDKLDFDVIYGCSGHQRIFWRCASCCYDWNIYKNGYHYCNKCQFDNAGNFNQDSFHVFKKIICDGSGNGNCSGFWRCA